MKPSSERKSKSNSWLQAQYYNLDNYRAERDHYIYVTSVLLRFTNPFKIATKWNQRIISHTGLSTEEFHANCNQIREERC